MISLAAQVFYRILPALREQVIAPLLVDVADPRIRRTPRHWTDIDRHYQALRLEMMVCSPKSAPPADDAPTTTATFCRSSSLKRPEREPWRPLPGHEHTQH
jgi:hypothetical protein